MKRYFDDKKIILLNSARNCLRYIIRAFKIKEIQIPYYICPSVRYAVQQENIKMKFYHIGLDFMPTGDFSPEEYILYPNYFGICHRQNLALSEKYANLISDNAHALFAQKTGCCSFYSPRKFIDVNDGGILYSDRFCREKFPVDEDRNIEISDFESFCKNETTLDNEPIKIMSLKTQNIIKTFDFSEEITGRKNLFNQIHNLMGEKNKINIKLDEDDVPYVYPLVSDISSKIYDYLDKNGVYILKYGSNLPKNYSEYIYSSKLIMLPLTKKTVYLLNQISG